MLVKVTQYDGWRSNGTGGADALKQKVSSPWEGGVALYIEASA